MRDMTECRAQGFECRAHRFLYPMREVECRAQIFWVACAVIESRFLCVTGSGVRDGNFINNLFISFSNLLIYHNFTVQIYKTLHTTLKTLFTAVPRCVTWLSAVRKVLSVVRTVFFIQCVKLSAVRKFSEWRAQWVTFSVRDWKRRAWQFLFCGVVLRYALCPR